MGDRDGKSDPRSTTEDAKLSERLRDLDRRLDASRAVRESDAAAENKEAAPSRAGIGMALRLGADFVAGVVVGAAIGWGIDRLFGTSPWGLAVFLLLGFAAGIVSLLRTAGLMKPGPAGNDDLLGRRDK